MKFVCNGLHFFKTFVELQDTGCCYIEIGKSGNHQNTYKNDTDKERNV